LTSELDSLLRVSRAVAHGDDLRVTLDRIAREAARVADARSASILLRRSSPSGEEQPFEVVGAYRLGPAYRSAIEHPTPLRRHSPGPSFLAMANDQQVVVEDTSTDERYAPWRPLALREGYRGFVSTPLHAPDRRVIGSLDVYREAPGPWDRAQLRLLALFVRHAAAALHTARLIDRQRQQLHALRHVVRTLEEQSHEHANRLHTIDGLIAIGEYEHARRLVAALQAGREGDERRISERIQDPTVRGLLVAQTAIAEQRGLALRITDRSRLARLPSTIDEAAAVTILGNLLDNAFDAVADLPHARRRVVVSFSETPRTTIWRVRDYGRGIPDDARREVFGRGKTSKARHLGLGLHLVAESVAQAHGRISVRHLSPGTSFAVSLPR
jgi:signal transduction histidine kinase